MQLSRHAGFRAGFFLMAFVALFASGSPVDAAPIVLTFDATLTDPGYPVSADDDVAVAAGAEILRANDTAVGDLFFDDEFVDVTSTAASSSLQYRLQGGGDAHLLAAGYSLTGWGSLATLTFSDFTLDVAGSFVGVTPSVETTLSGAPRVVGALGGALTPGVDYLFDPLAESLTIYLGGLGVLDMGTPALGSLSFALAFDADVEEPPVTPVPEPASLILVGTGLAAAARAARRRRANEGEKI